MCVCVCVCARARAGWGGRVGGGGVLENNTEQKLKRGLVCSAVAVFLSIIQACGYKYQGLFN